MTELKVCPSTLQEGFTSYSPDALKSLFDGKKVSHILDFDSPNNERADNKEYVQNVGRISLSGVQPKASLILNAVGQLAKPSENEHGTFILKPAPTSYALIERKYCPANEHLTMQLARQVYHIETAANALCFFRDGEAAYLCRRFDVAPDGHKYQQEDFASLAGLTDANGGSDYKYSNLSYEECADIIRRYVKAAPVEILKFFRIVVFNYLTLNDDAHICINTAIGRTTYLKVIPIRRPKTPLPKILRLPPLYFKLLTKVCRQPHRDGPQAFGRDSSLGTPLYVLKDTT